MEEIREAAFAFYEAGSAELKQSATTIFKSMDVDGDGKISISEFADFLKRNNYPHKWELFYEIDRDRSGYLDFCEVVVFFYISQTRKVWCDGCRSFIEGTYFICSDCFYKTRGGYDLCRACYCSQQYKSGHGPFFDNYATLNAVRELMVHQQPQPQQQSQATSREIKKGRENFQGKKKVLESERADIDDHGNYEELKQFLKILTLEAKAVAAVVNLENAAGCSIM